MISRLGFIKTEIDNMPQLKLYRFISVAPEGIKTFTSRISSAFVTVVQEPEVLLFAFLQWCSIVVGYFLWVQGWLLIPSIERAENDPVANILFLVWSVLIVGLVGLPVGIFSGGMGIVHFLRKQGLPSTFSLALRLAIRRYWHLWLFSWIDGWITVDQIFERLPKEGEKTLSATKIAREVLYFAWKAATLGIIPSVLNGRNLVDAARESLTMLRHRMRDVVLLRAGYSALCWIVGLGAYLCGLLFIDTGLFPHELKRHILDNIYFFYLYVGIPAVLGAGAVVLFLRPIFVLASCELYSEFAKVEKIKVYLPTDEGIVMKILSIGIVLVLALTTVAIILVVYLQNM